VGRITAVRVFLTLVVGALLLEGCAAKQNAASAQVNPSETTATAGRPLTPDPPARESSTGVPATEAYERAVADYNNCILDHTANLSACEKQRAIMNANRNAGSRLPASQCDKIINVER
jgi:PBP1b-binding outer membrane lipoprotein LpoB